ncbi:MAG: GNAT family N-acetyltransferase [Syntrophaceae bacterium]|nr:GNAT family N-acetyltransferase [Syntrophaceae bacterium]
MIQVSVPEDFDSWLILAGEVEHLFGPMCNIPEFRNALKSAILESRAFCVKSCFTGRPTVLEGGIVISHSPNTIAWLAVARSSQNQGIGSALVAHALSIFQEKGPVYVQTFAPSCPEGLSARKLYRRAGFNDLEPKEPTPAGVPTVLMVRKENR